ncbi:protein-glutamine gamma-glutamyltransferase k-like [Plakobranchus ocellatus]|uniref:Protein-glutamine gamma-glutamyltransferase k-like n=1 Tax=Plakobranchus ocellatus TaxID=259542 RepID=A0AAV4DWR2_9GAST|nr:protein-glutamine gamma-glutamyltransferase k-like [Plakobranchus ocellatus]
MYGRYRRDTDAPRSYSDPPWATDFNRATTISSSSSNRNVNYGNSRRGHGTGANRDARAGRAAANRSHDDERSGGNSHSLPYRVYRYGRRLWPRPSFRDYDFWARFRPYAAPHGTDSHRDRERVRRENRDRDNRRTRNEEEERNLVPEEAPLSKNVLTVKAVNLHITENTREHRTFQYDCTERSNNPCLVVRRGQVFIMTFTFQRPWSSEDDDLFLQFSVGEQPNERDGTLEKFQLNETDSTRYKQQGKWGAKIAKQDGPRLTVYVYIAPDAIIGEWECQVTTSLVNTSDKENFTFTGVPDIYVLFNPWCQDDQVYYTEKSSDLDEYVLNEYGCVFDGLADYIGRKPWYYGQFQDGILDVCMTLLRMAFDMEISKDMGDAIMVARKLSRIVKEERNLVPEEAPLSKNVLTVKAVNLHITENTREHRTFQYDCTERSNDPCLVVRRDDQVYYTEKSSDLDEYVLNEYGCVFDGLADYIGRKPWYYGQFQDGILDVCMTLLRMAFDMEISKDMGDAIMVARKLSRIVIPSGQAACGGTRTRDREAPADLGVGLLSTIPPKPLILGRYSKINNSRNDPGLITGNWSNSYADGTAPSSWKGSVQILKQYARTKTTVKYGQCWVFSHVLTTVCRALGLPCRSLTNFESAHDTDKTVTIDSYKDENGEDLPEYKTDSIWNFHCWNDVWINRPDLDSAYSARGRYSGWHALDSTPQERSEGRFQCGPSPHKAIKSGELSVGYDTSFIFAEVNGEMCTWMLPKNGSRRDIKLLSRDPTAIGKTISTKIPDGQPARGTFNPGAREVHTQRLDITHLYKHPEGSEEERAALQLAVGRGLGAKIFETPGGVNVGVLKPDGVMVGSDFTFSAVFRNSSQDGRRLDVTMGVFPIDYRGERLGWDKVAYSKMEGVVLKPGESRKFDLPVSERAYLKQCDKSMTMMLRASAKVEGEDKPVTKMEKMAMSVPDLKLEVPSGIGRIRRGHPFTLVVVASNPLKRPLTGCRLEITGPAFPLSTQGFSEGDGSYVKKIKDIFPSETTVLNVDIQANDRPLLNHTREVEISIISGQLPDMSGSLTFKLQE